MTLIFISTTIILEYGFNCLESILKSLFE